MCQGLIDDINPLPAPWGLVLFIVNIFLPGVGTMINSFVDPRGVKWGNLIAGILQLLFAVIIVGWIWSIYWGYLIWCKQIDLGAALDAIKDRD